MGSAEPGPATDIVAVRETSELEYVKLAASKTVWKLVASLFGLVILGFGTWMGFQQTAVAELNREMHAAEKQRAESAERMGRLEEKVGGIERGITRVETQMERVGDKLDRLLGK